MKTREEFNQELAQQIRGVLQKHEREVLARRDVRLAELRAAAAEQSATTNGTAVSRWRQEHAQAQRALDAAGCSLDVAIAEFTDTLYDAVHPEPDYEIVDASAPHYIKSITEEQTT